MTNLQKSADVKLRQQGSSLREFLDDQRRGGASYEQVARVLGDRTGVIVSHVTVRRWAMESVAAA